MKPSPLKLTLVSIFFSQLLTADLINQIGYRHIGSQVWQYMYVDSSQSFARTDEEVDETTVEATLYPNTQERRWELKFQSALTGETSLGAGLDINSNYELQIEAQIFDESHPQTLNSAKVMGDLTSLIYDETFDTATLLGRPRDLTPSATYPAGKTGFLWLISAIPAIMPLTPRAWLITAMQSSNPMCGSTILAIYSTRVQVAYGGVASV